MKKSLLLVLFCLCLFGHSFGQWQKAKLPASNAILSLAVDYSTSYVYAGSEGNGVYLSADTGDNWSTANIGLPANLNVWNILIKNKNIFLATNDGVYSSANNGNSWQHAGLKGVLVNSLTCYNNSDTTFLYAGTDKGIYQSKNNGLNWSMFAFSGFGVSAVFSNSSANFYAGMTAGGLNYYTDYRKIWAAADTGITNKTIIKTFSVGYNGMGDSKIIVGTNHGAFLEKSTGNWVQINTGLYSDTVVNSIISPDNFQIYNPGYLYFQGSTLAGTGKTTGNVYMLNGVGNNYLWNTLSTGIDGSVNTLAIYRNIVFAGGSSLWVLKSNLEYLYVSDYSASRIMHAVGDTVTFKINSNRFWYITDYFADWFTISPNTGTGDAIITVIAKQNNTNSMRFGSFSINSVTSKWLTYLQEPGNTTGIYNASSTNITIYPVPVKDELVISFPNQPENTRFAISNLSGVELLASQLAGSNTKVNMNGFKPGVYVLKIYSGNTCTTQKIIKQ